MPAEAGIFVLAVSCEGDAAIVNYAAANFLRLADSCLLIFPFGFYTAP